MYGKHTNICTVVISGSLIVDQLEKVFVPENTDPPIIRLVPLKLVVIPNLQTKTYCHNSSKQFKPTIDISTVYQNNLSHSYKIPNMLKNYFDQRKSFFAPPSRGAYKNLLAPQMFKDNIELRSPI